VRAVTARRARRSPAWSTGRSRTRRGSRSTTPRRASSCRRCLRTWSRARTGAPGKDTGALSSVGVAKAQGTAKETNGTLSIPADPNGGLSYKFANATATAGKVTIDSKNDASIGHDIAIEGNGVGEHGKVVQGGGTSTITATLKPGTYTFFCSVPGHRQGGMQGKLVVK
jgi:plastocyanin